MLTGNSLLDLVNEMQAQEPPAKLSEIVRACGYEIDGKLKYTQFYTELLDVKGLLPEQPELEISKEYQETYGRLCGDYGQDAVDTFLEIYGEENLDNFEDAYQGQYESERYFAEQYASDVYGLDIPSFVIVDWQATWDQGLRDCYEFQDGFVFSKNW
jgi:hypothetical protein